MDMFNLVIVAWFGKNEMKWLVVWEIFHNFAQMNMSLV